MDSKTELWIREMHDSVKEISSKYRLSGNELAPFLAGALCSQLAMSGYSDELVKETLDIIFKDYLTIKQLMESKK